MTKEEVTMHPGPEPPDGAKQAQPKQLQVLKLLGMEIPLPPWAVAVVAAIAIIGVAVVILCWILPHINGDQQLRETLANKQRELDEKEKQLQEKQKALERESVDVSAEIQFKESQKHAGEPGRQLYHQPTLHVAWYPDDGCVLVKRFGDNNINPARWILDPARIPTQPLP